MFLQRPSKGVSRLMDRAVLSERNIHMDHSRFSPGQWIARTGVAVGAAALLVTGAWHMSAAPRVAAESVAAQTPSITHAIAGGRDSYADVVKVIAPSVVTIRVEGRASVSPAQFQFPDGPSGDFFRRFFGDPGDRDDPAPAPRQRAPRQRGLGSGVIVSNDGYILTNNHVVDGADNIQVDMTDGQNVTETITAKLVGTDKASDLAVIKINRSGLHPLAMANSDSVQVGDVVLAVGNPLGVGQTVTMGIISAKGRSTGSGSGSYEDFLQTDAPINQGNSGGALVNLRGELVGINSQIVSSTTHLRRARARHSPRPRRRSGRAIPSPEFRRLRRAPAGSRTIGISPLSGLCVSGGLKCSLPPETSSRLRQSLSLCSTTG